MEKHNSDITTNRDFAPLNHIHRILNGFATGKFSLTAVRKQMAKAGLVGQRTGKAPCLNTIDKMLRNPFYYGVFVHKGERHQGTHVPFLTVSFKKPFDLLAETNIAERDAHGDFSTTSLWWSQGGSNS